MLLVIGLDSWYRLSGLDNDGKSGTPAEEKLAESELDETQEARLTPSGGGGELPPSRESERK